MQEQGLTSEPLSVTNGTNQGCVMAPLLLTLVFSAMLNDLGALIRFRIDGNIFNLPRLKCKRRISKVLIIYLLSASHRTFSADNRRYSSDYQSFLRIRQPFLIGHHTEENRGDLSAKGRSRLLGSSHHRRQQPAERH